MPLLQTMDLDQTNLKKSWPLSYLLKGFKLERLAAKQQAAARLPHYGKTAFFLTVSISGTSFDGDSSCQGTGGHPAGAEHMDLTMLTLLESSAAFDTVTHAMLLRRVTSTYGLCGTIINLFWTYLGDCKRTLTNLVIFLTQELALKNPTQACVLQHKFV
jgi:hypothetical protein